jgi:hypothetical protein
MPDLEALIVKGGVLVLALLSVIRLIVHDFNSLRNEWKRWRR